MNPLPVIADFHVSFPQIGTFFNGFQDVQFSILPIFLSI